MIATCNIMVFIILVKYIGFASCGFTYDDDYAEINKDNYGFDISEQHLVSAEQPKYNSMIRGYRGPPMPKVSEDLAIFGDSCDVDKYRQYYYPIHVLKTDAEVDTDLYHDKIAILEEEFFGQEKAGNFTKKQVCYHIVNPLYCKDGKCECLEVSETNYKGVKLDKQVSYDPLTLKHYKHCRIQEKFGCVPSESSFVLKCETGLYCGNMGKCMKSSSAQKQNLWGIVTVLIFMYKCLLV